MSAFYLNKFKVILAFMAVMLFLPLSALAEMDLPIAQVTRLKNSATLTWSGVVQDIDLNTKFQATDIIETGPDARLEITFEDGTTLTLGENARITLNEYVYDPINANNRLAISLRHGAFLFISGLMGKQPNRDMSVSTPLATIGIRGTTFWGGSLGNPLDVLLLDGKVIVESPTGSVMLDKKGKGTNIPVAGEKPTPAKFWSNEKRQRALSTVAF